MLRRILWLVLGLAAVLGVAVWFDRSLDPINPAIRERIKVGMTIAEVEATLGRPMDTSAPVRNPRCLGGAPTGQTCVFWLGKSHDLRVDFDPEGRQLIGSYCRRGILTPASPTASGPGLPDGDW
jgi:hypothetical protein